jgi:hypothetical protein
MRFPSTMLVGMLGSILAAAALAQGSPAYRLGERLAAPAGAATAAKFREIAWEDLIPRDWDPLANFKGLDLNNLQDGDPKAIRALEKLREDWDKAPTNPEMNGAAVRLAGFLVPLDDSRDLREFLLVPYFGACIHVPPPPANQIVHVVLPKPVSGFRTMDPVWVSGTLAARRGDSPWGASGYRMQAASVQAYKDDRKR